MKTLLLQPIGFLATTLRSCTTWISHFKHYAAELGLRLERPESLNGSRTLALALSGLAKRGLARLKESEFSNRTK